MPGSKEIKVPRVAFHTLGCKVNYADTEALAGVFRQEGFQVVDSQEEADVYVINTCTVTHVGDRKSRQVIRRTKRRHPGAMIVAVGCYSQVAPQELASIEEVDLVWGTRERHRLPQAIKEKVGKRVAVRPFFADTREERQVFLDHLPWDRQQERTRAFIKIQEGCQEYCSYCIVPYARGPVRSLALEKALEAAEKIVAAGYKEIVLTGVHLGKYGSDFGTFDLVQLLAEMVKIEGLFRIRLSSLEPGDITQELVQLIKNNGKVCRHLHIPLQSGDDNILKKMNRPYSASHFVMLADYLKEQLPGVALTSDIMVGFPGEGEEEFLHTKEIVREVAFARLHVFKYSPRKNTPAASFPQQVPAVQKEKRSKEMIALGKELEARYRRSLQGKMVTVLFESKEGNYLEGLTEQYVKTRVYAPDASRGEVWLVKLVQDKKDYFVGEIINPLRK
ncbi:MAG: tRNA (N(6)-L-threonylcarbamoyladenosine(37)-C(2))-methylthiotransferase MtaB [Firmicutes bacterium]|nr:tRNA (N(6)-L-threonylcarbamoyladenosine(37)-C(2))-methylthiotransferase MtaB [Bacillota bacterium]